LKNERVVQKYGCYNLGKNKECGLASRQVKTHCHCSQRRNYSGPWRHMVSIKKRSYSI